MEIRRCGFGWRRRPTTGRARSCSTPTPSQDGCWPISREISPPLARRAPRRRWRRWKMWCRLRPCQRKAGPTKRSLAGLWQSVLLLRIGCAPCWRSTWRRSAWPPRHRPRRRPRPAASAQAPRSTSAESGAVASAAVPAGPMARAPGPQTWTASGLGCPEPWKDAFSAASAAPFGSSTKADALLWIPSSPDGPRSCRRTRMRHCSQTWRWVPSLQDFAVARGTARRQTARATRARPRPRRPPSRRSPDRTRSCLALPWAAASPLPSAPAPAPPAAVPEPVPAPAASGGQVPRLNRRPRSTSWRTFFLPLLARSRMGSTCEPRPPCLKSRRRWARRAVAHPERPWRRWRAPSWR
mmetsp:Transcript_65276/g.168552  ORF Transcript_65276/g.168552 Transcript_65276/m.168552 type:complete len:353 (+) Transcript_65276:250-1308(+)